jgi:hypothetical protein
MESVGILVVMETIKIVPDWGISNLHGNLGFDSFCKYVFMDRECRGIND